MTTEIHGHCEPAWEGIAESFASNFEEGLELGASVCVVEDERLVLDLWAGHADRKRTRPWTRDTLTQVFSSIKVPLNASMLKLVSDQGLDLDARVTTWWPEYGAAGKERTTLRDVMTHRAGIPAFDPPQPFEAMQDWDHVIDVLAACTPMFEPGSTLCYHPVTHGFVLGEILRRVDGRGISDYFREELAVPMGLDVHFRLHDEIAPRLSQQFWTWHPPSGDDLHMKILSSVGPGHPEDPDRLRAEVPSSNGFANARGMALLGAMLAQDGVWQDRRYIDAALVQEARSEQVHAVDTIFGEMRMGLGFGLDSDFFPAATPDAFHWGGMGGSFVTMMPARRSAMSYVMNHYVLEENEMFDPRWRLWKDLRSLVTGADG